MKRKREKSFFFASLNPFSHTFTAQNLEISKTHKKHVPLFFSYRPPHRAPPRGAAARASCHGSLGS